MFGELALSVYPVVGGQAGPRKERLELSDLAASVVWICRLVNGLADRFELAPRLRVGRLRQRLIALVRAVTSGEEERRGETDREVPRAHAKEASTAVARGIAADPVDTVRAQRYLAGRGDR